MAHQTSSALRMMAPISSSLSAVSTSSSFGQDVDQRHTAAGDDALFDRRAGRLQGVLDADFFSMSSDSVPTPTPRHRHAAGQLRQALLQLSRSEVRSTRSSSALILG